MITRWTTELTATTQQQGAAILELERMLNLLTTQFEFDTPPSDTDTMAEQLALMQLDVTQTDNTDSHLTTMADTRHQRVLTAQTALLTGKQLATAFEDRKTTAAALATLAETKQTQEDRRLLMERLTWVTEHEAAETRVTKVARDLTSAQTTLVTTTTDIKTTLQAMNQATTKLNDLQTTDTEFEATKTTLDTLTSVKQTLVDIAETEKTVATTTAAVAQAEAASVQATKKLADELKKLDTYTTELNTSAVTDLADRAADHKTLVAALKPVAEYYTDAHAEAETLARQSTDNKTLLILANNASTSAETQLNTLTTTLIRTTIATLAE